MKSYTIKNLTLFLFLGFILFQPAKLVAQCDSITPFFNVDLSSNADTIWTSPSVLRDGNCCGAVNSDLCVSFSLTLAADAQGIVFSVCDGALAPGSNFYRVDCGPPQSVGSVLCLIGTGPFLITFCKPGSNTNKYCITSLPLPSGGPNLSVNDGCTDTLSSSGFQDTSIVWTSIFPGAVGDYDTLLSCTEDCASTIVTGGNNLPAFIDYQVCGVQITPCTPIYFCDTVRVSFFNSLNVEINPKNPTVCFNQTNTWIKAIASGGSPPYSYSWSNGLSTDSIQVGVGTYIVELSDISGCPSTFDTVVVTAFANPITANAGTNQTICRQNFPFQLNGSVMAASGGKWLGGNGTFAPNDSSLNATYSPSPAELTAGSVNLVLITTGNGTCPPDQETVTFVFEEFDANITSTVTNVSCFGGSDGAIILNLSSGAVPFAFQWNPTVNSTSNLANNLSAGTYRFTITDGNGCSKIDSVIITEPTVLSSTISSSVNVSCNAGSDGTATVTASGGTTPYSYSWPSGDTMATDAGLTQGTYIITVTDFNNCASTDTVIITEPTVLSSVISASVNVSCNSGSNGAATVSASGGTTPYSYSWPSGDTTATDTGLTQGNFVVTVTDSNNCTSTSSIIITEPNVLTLAIGTSTNVSCNGGADGTATVTTSGGTAPYSYAWPSGDTMATDTGLTQGTYVVTVTDFNNCTSTDTIIITEPNLLTSTISSFTSISCNGSSDGTATVTASGGTTPYTYAWPSGTPTTTDTGLGQGTFVVTVTDFNNCTSTSSVIITEPSVLTSTVGTSTNVSCNGGADGTATVTASGGTTPYSYSWPSGDTTATDTALTQGTYVVTVTDFNNCTSTDTVIITEPGILTSTISAFTAVSCNGGANGTATVTATGGTTPYSYAWPSGTPTATETGLSQGTYVVTVTDSNNCTSTSSINITEPTILTSAIGTSTNVSCNGGADGTATINVTGGTAPYSYSWPSGDTTASDSGLTQGTYVVTVTDFNNCTSTDTVIINEPSILTSTISGFTAVSCNGGANGTATVTASGGTVPYSYSWPSGTPTATETGLSQGNYVVTVTDSNNCTSTSAISITQPDSLTITAENIPVSCFGLADGQLIVTPVGGTSPYTFNWSNNVTDSINSGLVIGNYQVIVTDSNGCLVDSSFTIVQPDIISLLVSPYDTICIGNSTTIQAIARGGNSSFTYTWNNNLSNSSTHRVSPTTQTSYTVNVTDGKGCSTSQDSIIITIRDLSKDNLLAFSSGNICVGDTTNLTATHSGTLGGYGYTWSNNVGNGLGPIPVSPTTTTQYIVSAFDVCGSIISDSIDVIVENYPLVNLPSIIKEGCEPLTVNFIDTINSVPNNLTYTWDLGDGSTSNSNNFNYTYDADGTYSITLSISTPEGCESNSTNQSQVIVYPTPEANFSINPNETDLNNSTVTFTNTSVNTNNVEWDFYNSFTSIKNDTIIQFNDTGWFPIKLVAYSRFGCKDSAFKNLRVNPVYELIIPNAFTPNTGGSNGGFYDKNNLNNDVFYIHTDLILSYEMQIFNRWGELIFLSKDVNRGWDGYYLGKLSPQDVYVYKVSVVFINGKRETKTGNFTLFR